MIVDTAITTDVNDHHQLTPAMERVEETFQRKPEQAVADGDYTTNRSVVEMAEREIDFYGSWSQAAKTGGSKNKQHPEFRKESFTYEAAADRYRCPADKFLIFSRRQEHENGTVQRIYRSSTKQCRECEHFAQCVTEKREIADVTAADISTAMNSTQ